VRTFVASEQGLERWGEASGTTAPGGSVQRGNKMGRKPNTLNLKKMIFCSRKFFKLLKKKSGYPITSEFSKYVIYVRGVRCDCSSRASKTSGYASATECVVKRATHFTDSAER
jgi:hypothetical protein